MLHTCYALCQSALSLCAVAGWPRLLRCMVARSNCHSSTYRTQPIPQLRQAGSALGSCFVPTAAARPASPGRTTGRGTGGRWRSPGRGARTGPQSRRRGQRGWGRGCAAAALQHGGVEPWHAVGEVAGWQQASVTMVPVSVPVGHACGTVNGVLQDPCCKSVRATSPPNTIPRYPCALPPPSDRTTGTGNGACPPFPLHALLMLKGAAAVPCPRHAAHSPGVLRPKNPSMPSATRRLPGGKLK